MLRTKSPKRPKESKVSLETRKHFEARGWWAVKIVASAEQRSGLPDIIAARNGRMYGIEMKVIDTDNCKLDYTPKQRATLWGMAKSSIPAMGLAYAWKTDMWVLEVFSNVNTVTRMVFMKRDHVIDYLLLI